MAPIDRERLVCIGRVLGAHGLKGELKVRPLTSTPQYYESTASVILDAGAGLRHFEVNGIRGAGGLWVLSLTGVEDRDAALGLKGAEVLLEEAALRPLEPGEYFIDDLIGCEMETLSGERLGRVDGWIETGANDVLSVATAGGAALVPMTAEVVKQVDVEARRIRIDPLPGLFDAGQSKSEG